MNIFKKFFKSYQESSKEKEVKAQPVHLALDDSFVHNFINKGGKFLYCSSFNEVNSNFKQILQENNWKEISCYDIDLQKIATQNNAIIKNESNTKLPFFTSCEHLIANKGDILFSSNQLGSKKLSSFSENFIVYATTSQLVKNTGEGLTGIKTNFKGNIPTNIGSITNYKVDNSNEENFLNYGNTNSKNLYLLLFEDL